MRSDKIFLDIFDSNGINVYSGNAILKRNWFNEKYPEGLDINIKTHLMKVNPYFFEKIIYLDINLIDKLCGQFIMSSENYVLKFNKKKFHIHGHQITGIGVNNEPPVYYIKY